MSWDTNCGHWHPPGCEGARVADPSAVVWNGDQSLPTDRQGVVVWVAPMGHAHFVARELQAMTEEYTALFRRILAVLDSPVCMASAIVLCRDPGQLLLEGRATCCVRTIRDYYENVWNCTQELLDIEGTVRARQLSSLPLALGGLGLRSAIRSQNAAYWASWADSLPRIRERHPDIADLIGVALFRGRFPEDSSLQAAEMCRERLLHVVFDAPEWEDVVRGQRPGRSPQNRDPFRVAMFGQR